MAKRTRSICSRPGCNRLVDSGRGWCVPCSDKHNTQDRAQRGSASVRGYGRQHRKWRLAVLARDPICQRCLTVEGRFRAATVADHIVPWKGRHAALKYSMENGQGLCAACHNIKGAYEARGEYFDWRHKDGDQGR